MADSTEGRIVNVPGIQGFRVHLQNEVQCQRQKGIAAGLLAVSGDEEQQKHDDEVSGVEPLWDQLPQKTGNGFRLG